MKPYKQVVAERYDGYEKGAHIYKNIYSLINPVGFNADKRIRQAFYRAFNFIRNNQSDISKSIILDIGCGKGQTTRYFSELTGSPEHIYGIDLSKNRIENAKKMNPAINYQVGDMVTLPAMVQNADIITALDVFMHLAEKHEIDAALQNIYTHLNADGYFIWFDSYAKDHFSAKPEADHCGFSTKQMIEFACNAGFAQVFQTNLYKTLFGRYHSLYLITKFPEWLINFLEKVLPGPPGNILMIFKKSKP